MMYYLEKKRVIGALAGFMLVFSSFAPAAHAQTNAELQAQIAALLAQIAILQGQVGGGVQASYTFTRDLTVGATGEDVRQLQRFLNGKGYTVAASGAGSAGMESAYFGSLTAAALARYQSAKGISPAVGYFGPITRAAVHADMAVVVPTPTPTPNPNDNDDDLSGGAGSISDADYVTKISNEEVGEGQEDVEVAGLEIEAEGSDIELAAVRLNFSQGTADRDFRRYADEVSIWFNGDEVARVDARDFTKNNNYDRTISLDRGAIIREGRVGEIVVAVSALNNIDSGDVGETWTVEFESIRFRDAQGAVITDSSTGDINDGAGRTFSFEDFASAANVELRITDGDREINNTRIIIADGSNDTDDVELFSFNLQARGDSDIVIDALPITFDSTDAGVGEMVNTVQLWIDGDLIGSESVSSTTATSRVIVFDNLDYTIDAGDTVEVLVVADFNNFSGGFAEGSTIKATFGETETDLASFDVEDEEGNDLSDSDKSGSASSESHVLYEIAPTIDVLSTSITANPNGDAPAESATARVRMKVTAVGGTLYLNGDDATEVNRFFLGAVYGSGVSASTTASTTTYTLTNNSGSVVNPGTVNEYYALDEGESVTIEITAIVNQSTITTSPVLAGFKASAIQFGTDATNATTRSAKTLQYTDLLDETQSGTILLRNAS